MTKDMTTGAITPLLVKFTIPLVLGNLFQLTYNAADSIIVGKFVGEEALAAVGTSNPRMTLAILFIQNGSHRAHLMEHSGHLTGHQAARGSVALKDGTAQAAQRVFFQLHLIGTGPLR